MRLLSWNSQRLEYPWTGCDLCRIVREQAPTVCFLMETQWDKEGFLKLYDNLPFSNRIVVKHSDSGPGVDWH